MRTFLIFAAAVSLYGAHKIPFTNHHKADEWKMIFDGTSLDGWKANEHPESWTVKDGAIRGDGPASHLFYMDAKCVNCEFKAEVRINHGGNSGMYVRTAFGPGFPRGTRRRSITPILIRSAPAASTISSRFISN